MKTKIFLIILLFCFCLGACGKGNTTPAESETTGPTDETEEVAQTNDGVFGCYKYNDTYLKLEIF